MKILKIFGVVVGIHLFALVLIFANPGCSSTSKPPPQPVDTVAKTEPVPSITVPSPAAPASLDVTPVPATFNPDAPAGYSGGSPGVRFMPTRPNTPAASAVLAQPVENITPATTYVVKAGDSLWTLQKKFKVSFKDIATANNLKTSSPLHEGQKLIIPSKAPAPASAPKATSAAPAAAMSTAHSDTGATKATNGEVTYTVKAGDTIDAIAKRFEVKAKDLAVHNNIENPLRLRPGMVLNIPGWKSAGAGKASAAASSEASRSAAQPAVERPAAPIIDLEQPQPSSPPPASNVPIIRLDDTTGAAAPKP